jgi:ubiquinone/menaquinone biosynthesis C-methylase UbiE
MPIQNENELIKVDVLAKIGVNAGMAVGDFGCGNLGYFSLISAKRVGQSGTVYAVDILKSALESVANIARQNGLNNVKTVWSNLEMLGAARIPAGTLDVVFLHNVLFQSKKKDLIIKEGQRLLKDGGKIMIIDWLKAKTAVGFGPPEAARPDPEDIKKIGQKIGLRLLEEFVAGPYHFGLIFIK